MNEQIVSITFFKFEGFWNQFWAFKEMGMPAPNIKSATFQKKMGSGSGNGFGISPDFGTYSLLFVWKDKAAANHFFDNHSYFKKYKKRATTYCTLYLKTITAHGKWDGQSPFIPNTELKSDDIIGIITRGTVRTRKLHRFWKYVPKVSRSMTEMKKKSLFAIGIGELPLIQQATFSLWKDLESVKNYAYKSKLHSEVVKLTRTENWYKEDLFARFILIEMFGDTTLLPKGIPQLLKV